MSKLWLGVIGVVAISSVFFGNSIDEIVRHAFFSSGEPVLEIPLTADLKESVRLKETKAPIRKTVVSAPVVFVATSTSQTVVPSTTPNKIPQNNFNPQPAATSSPSATSSALQTFESQPEPIPTPPTPPATEVQHQNVLINEILYDAEGSDTGKEFIELYNPTLNDISLADWSLFNGSNSLANIGSKPEDITIIKAGKFLLVGLNSYTGSPSADVKRSASMPNTAATIVLKDNNGVVIESVGYQEGFVSSGQSLERKTSNEFAPQNIPNPQNSQN